MSNIVRIYIGLKIPIEMREYQEEEVCSEEEFAIVGYSCMNNVVIVILIYVVSKQFKDEQKLLIFLSFCHLFTFLFFTFGFACLDRSCTLALFSPMLLVLD